MRVVHFSDRTRLHKSKSALDPGWQNAQKSFSLKSKPLICENRVKYLQSISLFSQIQRKISILFPRALVLYVL
jgi:hypothetical protein